MRVAANDMHMVFYGGENYQSQFAIQRGPLSPLAVIENVAFVTSEYRQKPVTYVLYKLFCRDFIIFFSFLRASGDESRERDTDKTRLEYQCRKSSPDKNVIYVRPATATFCIFCTFTPDLQCRDIELHL